jgi:hypothetical protein
MKDSSEKYQPEWINAADAAAWLGIEENTLFKWRTRLALHWTNINGKTIMYDKRQINQLLNQNSTYAALIKKQLA